MNWISRLTRPTIKALNQKKEVPDHFWDKCPGCGTLLYHTEISQNHFVCPHCNYHFALPILKRLEMLFDNEEFTIVQLPKITDDPLNFSDTKSYPDRLKDARKKTKNPDAFVVACGKVGGKNAVIGIFDFSFMGGSMGIAVGEAFLKAVQLAVLQEAALIVLTASGGARMQEGMLSLMQMARTTIGIEQLKAKNLPYIVILTHPTTGGVTASLAMLGDITLAEPGAIIGFAGPRVIEQTIRAKLPENFQKAEYLEAHGMVDRVVNRVDLKNELLILLPYLMP